MPLARHITGAEIDLANFQRYASNHVVGLRTTSGS